MTVTRIVALGLTLTLALACGAPTTPSSDFRVTCNQQIILAGQTVECNAIAAGVYVRDDATWTSTDERILRSEFLGRFMGRTDGRASAAATYAGQTASVELTVRLQDVVAVLAGGNIGSAFKTGNTVSLTLQGFYGVKSAEAGTLMLVLTDQNGRTLTTSAPQTVPRGGERYAVFANLFLTPETTRVCRAVRLQIGSTVLEATPPGDIAHCFDVAR